MHPSPGEPNGRSNSLTASLERGQSKPEMRRYFFDLRDGDDLAPDEEGMEFPMLDAVRTEAARSLAEMARDAARTSHNGVDYRMAIEVRDDNGPVLQVKFTLEIDRHGL